jgi:hypothetical protein
MDRNGWPLNPLSSMGVLCNFLCFQIQVLTLLIGAFSVSVPLLKVGILGCVAMVLPLHIRQVLGDQLRVFEHSFFLMGWYVWYRWFLQSDPTRNWYVNNSWHLWLTRLAWELELSFLVSYFSIRSLSVAVHYQFLQGGRIYCLIRLWGPSCSHTGCISSVFCPTPIKGEISPLFMATNFVPECCNLPITS